MIKYYIIAMLVMSVISFLTFGLDKLKAKNGKWRIPEKTLFATALLLGGPGALIGMYLFRHKTKHIQFQIFIPLIAAIEIAGGVLIYIFL